jgi:predicted HTH transcriptional regulator
VPNEHYQEVGMNMYSDTIIINSPNILNTTINPINPMDYSSEDIIESMKYIKE